MSGIGNIWRKVVERFLGHWLDLLVIGLTAAAGLYAKDWLFTPVSIWPLIPFLGAILIVFLGYRLWKLRERPYHPIRIRDIDLDTVWWLQTNPEYRIESVFDRNHPDGYTDSLVDGPYCGRKRDNGDDCLGDFSRRDNDNLSERCHICKRGLFEVADGEPKQVNLSVSHLKLLVIHALQREFRRGRKIKGNFQFGVVDENTRK